MDPPNCCIRSFMGQNLFILFKEKVGVLHLLNNLYLKPHDLNENFLKH